MVSLCLLQVVPAQLLKMTIPNWRDMSKTHLVITIQTWDDAPPVMRPGSKVIPLALRRDP